MTPGAADVAAACALTAADIPWTRPPLPRLERVALLALNDDERVSYARDLQRELTWVRVLLHESVALNGRLTGLCDRLQRTVRTFHETAQTVRKAS